MVVEPFLAIGSGIDWVALFVSISLLQISLMASFKLETADSSLGVENLYHGFNVPSITFLKQYTYVNVPENLPNTIVPSRI